jgi:hypothetical protein
VTVESGGDETDWARVLAMTEDELEAAPRCAVPPILIGRSCPGIGTRTPSPLDAGQERRPVATAQEQLTSSDVLVSSVLLLCMATC